MQNVLLKITGKQNTEGLPDSDPIEFVTEGRLSEKDGVLFLEYDETELSGMEGCTTLVEIHPGRVRMTRTGSSIPLDTVMEFEAGKRFSSVYQTDMGPIEMELLTYSVQNTLLAGSGAVSIDYHVSLKGLGEIRNLLEIAVVESKNEAVMN